MRIIADGLNCFFYVEHSYFDIFHFVLERKREIFAGTSIT